MPGRQSHGNPLLGKPKAKKTKNISRNNSSKRALDAFAIASHDGSDRVKIRQSRLGAQEGGGSRSAKRRRNEEEDAEDDEEDEENTRRQKKPQVKKGRFDELDLDEGSDSEGNEWKLGQVDEDDDSDLDSDEAFGESDEEKFEGYAFSGSSKNKSKKPKNPTRDINLDEDDVEDSDSELEDGDLGEGAVDLATMLDMAEAEEAEEVQPGKPKKQVKEDSYSEEDDDASEDSQDSENDEGVSSISSGEDDDETADPEKLAALQNLIASLPATEGSRGPAKQRSDGASEYNTPSDFGLTSKTKLTLEDLGLPAIHDPHIMKSLKFLAEDGSSKKKAVAKLSVPLAKRSQDRVDRSAAYEKSKETLDRWKDTVKHNRQAEHLVFPLPDRDVSSAKSTATLAPTNQSKPFNELEATIQNILEESGLASKKGTDAGEEKIMAYEELETKKLSLREVKARTEQLRMARELLFREEARAKRIKKIKSKSFRKVHRKEREREERKNAEALAEGGYVPSEDEEEAQDRRRAEERMGAKHRESKWAKAMKNSGRSTWDEDARSGVVEMARREEELRKRVEGRAVRKEFENESEESASDSDISGDDEAGQQNRLMKKLNSLEDSGLMDESLPGAKLANMDFMRKGEAARKKNNDVMIAEMKRDLAGEESTDEDVVEPGDIGRRIFGPKSGEESKPKKPKVLNEFEERLGSDDEENEDRSQARPPNPDSRDVATTSGNKKAKKSVKISEIASQPHLDSTSEGGAWSKATGKSTTVNEAEAKRRRHKKGNAVDVEELDLSQAVVIATQPKSQKKAKKSSGKGIQSTATEQEQEVEEEDESNDETETYLPFALRDQALIKRAFAGDDTVGDFEQEKQQTMEDEDEKMVDNSIPGWGTWIGDGVKKRKSAKPKVLTKQAGIAKNKRKDAKLQRVIINEKPVKKNEKYLATRLPHPFENREQYERSLRLPIGPEWTTKQTFQEATKPRVIVKQGSIITPMLKPIL